MVASLPTRQTPRTRSSGHRVYGLEGQGFQDPGMAAFSFQGGFSAEILRQMKELQRKNKRTRTSFRLGLEGVFAV